MYCTNNLTSADSPTVTITLRWGTDGTGDTTNYRRWGNTFNWTYITPLPVIPRKNWRWFHAFAQPIAPAAVRIAARAIAVVRHTLAPPEVQRARWKRRRFVQALYA